MKAADTHIEVAIEDQIKIEKDLKEAVARGDQALAELQAIRDKHNAEAKAMDEKLAAAEEAKRQAEDNAIYAQAPMPPTYVPYTHDTYPYGQWYGYPYTQYYTYPAFYTTTINSIPANTWHLSNSYQTAANTIGCYGNYQ